MRSIRISFVLVVLVLVVLGTGLIDHKQRSLVDWSRVRAVAIQSDDWGLCGFVPNDSALEGLDPDSLGGTKFPPAYWRSTLEDSSDVAAMSELLSRHVGRDGLPVVFQPNMIMGHEVLTEDGTWVTGSIRDGWPDRYERPGLWSAVSEAMEAGVWAPELHGFLHYVASDPRERVLDSGPQVAEAALRGVLVFPGAHQSFELGPGQEIQGLDVLWGRMITDQEAMFDRRPVSVVAPDYVWDDRHEELWSHLGVRCIQAKRSQRRRDLGGPEPLRRIRKYVERQWALWTDADFTYLERNCRLETAQAPDPEAERDSCRRQALDAWRQGRPAVVEAHRVNYVQTDGQGEEQGRLLLDSLLTELGAHAPLYAADAELAGWARRGVSTDRRGSRWFVRNPGPAARLAVIEADGPRTVLVPPFTTLILDRGGKSIVETISLR